MQNTTPTACLEAYFKAWQAKDWGARAALFQRSWVRKGLTEMGDHRLDFLERFEIHDEQWFSPVLCDVTATVWEWSYTEVTNKKRPLKASKVRERESRWRVVCEDARGRPSTDGKWGVNPPSGIRPFDRPI